jgi:hypothetical protein
MTQGVCTLSIFGILLCHKPEATIMITNRPCHVVFSLEFYPREGKWIPKWDLTALVQTSTSVEWR